MPSRLIIIHSASGPTIGYIGPDGQKLVLAQPINLQLLGEATEQFSYDDIDGADDSYWTAVAQISLRDQTRLVVTDDYVLVDEGRLRLSRDVTITKAGTSTGLRLGLLTNTTGPGARTEE